MSAITVTIQNDSLTAVFAELKEQITSKVTRAVATSMLAVVKKRIHTDGLDAGGNKIGEYSSSYLKYREKKFNRNADKDVVLSLTRQMENDFTVIADNDVVGLGFNNPLNFQKAGWCEETYKKPIYALTEQEEVLATEIASQAVNDALHG